MSLKLVDNNDKVAGSNIRPSPSLPRNINYIIKMKHKLLLVLNNYTFSF